MAQWDTKRHRSSKPRHSPTDRPEMKCLRQRFIGLTFPFRTITEVWTFTTPLCWTLGDPQRHAGFLPKRDDLTWQSIEGGPTRRSTLRGHRSYVLKPPGPGFEMRGGGDCGNALLVFLEYTIRLHLWTSMVIGGPNHHIPRRADSSGNLGPTGLLSLVVECRVMRGRARWRTTLCMP